MCDVAVVHSTTDSSTRSRPVRRPTREPRACAITPRPDRLPAACSWFDGAPQSRGPCNARDFADDAPHEQHAPRTAGSAGRRHRAVRSRSAPAAHAARSSTRRLRARARPRERALALSARGSTFSVPMRHALDDDAAEPTEPTTLCVGAHCGVPADLRCPCCGVQLCGACAREHCDASASLCSAPALPVAVAGR